MNHYRIINDELQKLGKETGVGCLTDTEMLWDRGCQQMLIGFIPFGANFYMTTEEIEGVSALKSILKDRIITSIQDSIRILRADIEKLLR